MSGGRPGRARRRCLHCGRFLRADATEPRCSACADGQGPTAAPDGAPASPSGLTGGIPGIQLPSSLAPSAPSSCPKAPSGYPLSRWAHANRRSPCPRFPTEPPASFRGQASCISFDPRPLDAARSFGISRSVSDLTARSGAAGNGRRGARWRRGAISADAVARTPAARRSATWSGARRGSRTARNREGTVLRQSRVPIGRARRRPTARPTPSRTGAESRHRLRPAPRWTAAPCSGGDVPAASWPRIAPGGNASL